MTPAGMRILIMGMLSFSVVAAPANRWQRASFEGAELEYRSSGAGTAVVFVHAGVFGEWFEPLLREPALQRGYRLVTYHRTGYGGSGRVSGAMSIAQQAAQLRALLDHLGIARAHVVGHSSGGVIALQLALDAPARVQTLAALEPAIPVVSAPSSVQPASRPGIAVAMERYRAGDKSGAVDTFLRIVAGANYRATLDQRLPGAFASAVASADTFFAQELPAVRAWTFDVEDAARIQQRVLAVMGERSPGVAPIWQQRQDWLMASLPQAESFVLGDATHLLHLENARDMAERLAAFFAAHPR